MKSPLPITVSATILMVVTSIFLISKMSEGPQILTVAAGLFSAVILALWYIWRRWGWKPLAVMCIMAIVIPVAINMLPQNGDKLTPVRYEPDEKPWEKYAVQKPGNYFDRFDTPGDDNPFLKYKREKSPGF